MSSEAVRRALVFGAGGALGRCLVRHLRQSSPSWTVVGVDVIHSADADHEIRVLGGGIQAQAVEVTRELRKLPLQKNGERLDAIFCVSGGFASAPVDESHYLEVADRMITSSICPTLVAARLSAKFLKRGGLLTLPGAEAAKAHNPVGPLGPYGAAKAYVHYLTKSLADSKSGMPEGSKVIAISPIMLDTEANRAAMPQSDRAGWTPLDALSLKLVSWANDPHRLRTGDIVTVKTDDFETTFKTDGGETL